MNQRSYLHVEKKTHWREQENGAENLTDLRENIISQFYDK